VDGFVGYRQPYEATGAEYGSSETFWDEDYATSANCARCKRDVTELFQRLNVLVFYVPAWREKVI